MGNKHNKKRYFCVKYVFKPDKKFDELSKLWRKIGYKVFTRKEMDKWLES